ncbi:hypothetical protein CSIM01_06264 [Colletotrichum simmondsii]|uniref:Uncharacterized protein n=1 Tax=Colletotrichum simmondsii TaxID=703756 RepID=A0A135S0U3_9PEZI|nr:hypothetical protein CSIM01_06264 [Colletotrichum simmondsii]
MDVNDRQSLITRLKNSVPLLFRKRQTMSKPEEFRATDTITHHYADADVLKRMLVRFKFAEKTIKIRATKAKGFEVQLPRRLTAEEKEEILTEFEEEAEKRAMAALD